MDEKKLNVLFLCTGNSARSIFAEAIMNKLGAAKFRAYSAGSHPRGTVHPMTTECLMKARIDTNDLRSKNWDEFGKPDAPHMHFVITVCDQAAGELCPTWPGQPLTAHWGFADPVAIAGSEETRLRAFQQVMYEISNRVSILLSLPMEKLDRLALQEKVREIGKVPPSTEIPDFLHKD